jgi:hypothetical protein
MSGMVLTLYRAVAEDPPTSEDFASNKAKGKPRRDIESEEVWSGISVYDTKERCRKKAAQFGLGTHIAELTIPADAPIQRGAIGRGGHCTLWGEPEDFLAYVTAIVPV